MMRTGIETDEASAVAATDVQQQRPRA